MEFRINQGWSGFTYVRISLRSRPEKIEDVFTSGNCHSFALALHALTGWELMGMYRGGETDMASHVFVKNEKGNFVDVTGERTPEEFYREWRGEFKSITKNDIDSWVEKFNTEGMGYIPARVKDTLPFAKRLLKAIDGY